MLFVLNADLNLFYRFADVIRNGSEVVFLANL